MEAALIRAEQFYGLKEAKEEKGSGGDSGEMTSPNEWMQPTEPAFRRSKVAVSWAGPAADPGVRPILCCEVSVAFVNELTLDGEKLTNCTWEQVAQTFERVLSARWGFLQMVGERGV
jgi:hypothetical protein